MSDEKTKGILESGVLEQFIRVSGLALDPSSIAKQDPLTGAPDLTCKHRDGTMIAFELAEICSPDLAQMVNDPRSGGQVKWIKNATEVIVQKKLAAQYVTDHPMELLCYTKGRMPVPDGVTIPTIANAIRRGQCRFRRIWFLGESGAHLIWEAT